MIFVCREENDLYQVLQASGHAYPRRESLDTAIEEAQPGEGILALADEYPRPSSAVTAAQLTAARAKKLRLFLEYPASLPDCPLGAPQPTQWERAVIASNFFAPALRPGAILALHGCWFLPAPSVDAHLAAARVAGYREAVYGLPEDAAPILFPFGGEGVLVAATGLSRFVTGRYGPGSAWKAIWERILHW
ncbi:MAG TPA: hypothetical protein VHR86_00530, partial [Armatimonadota bacterium]|nr:hypothetical protein [Armatimonadota bacterium]